MAESGWTQDGALVAPDEPKIGYSDYVQLEQLDDPASPTGKTARFSRILDMPGKGYRWDNPGARVRFRTDAASVEVLLRYTERHISISARNPVGRYWIDRKTEPAWTFRTRSVAVRREPESATLSLTSLAPGFHDYEVAMPYGDSVEFQGLRLPAGAKLEAPVARPAIRYVAYGDSITQGFTASEVSKSYASLVAEKMGWQLVNMGFGGRAAMSQDAAVVASLAPDVVTILMGANDWQGGATVASYKARMSNFFTYFRNEKPKVPIYFITSLWVTPSWKPQAAVAGLEEYRQAMREMVAERNDPNLHLVEGPSLIDSDLGLFDATPVHPNDAGFAMMAERLLKVIAPLP